MSRNHRNGHHVEAMSKVTLPDMPANEIHVWSWRLEQLTRDIEAAVYPSLTGSERARHSNFRFSKDREHYLLAHYMLRTIIEFYCGSEVAGREFVTNSYGKPSIGNSVFEFNLSHSGEYAVVACSMKIPLGVDVEKKRSDFDYLEVGEHFFTYEECCHIRSSDDSEDTFFRYWTIKEAIVKAIGQGLSVGLNSISLGLDQCCPEVVTWESSQEGAKDYAIVECSPDPAYSMSLAYEVGSGNISIQRFDFGG
ncbi:MAG: 4'-phosphopantetheinyl transferase family protein [Opitutaceae bacterium]